MNRELRIKYTVTFDVVNSFFQWKLTCNAKYLKDQYAVMIAIAEVYNSMLELYKFFLTYMVHLDVENGCPMGDLVEKLISNPDK